MQNIPWPALKGILLSLLCILLLPQGCATIVRKATCAYIIVTYALPSSNISITLGNSFIAAYKDKATIDVMLTVDKVPRKVNPAYRDGDLHIAGRAPEICLPVVAEISNAATEMGAVDTIHKAEGTGVPIRIAGAWRLWSEHSGSGEEVQGEELPGFDLTNPRHVFEVHPVTRVGDMDVSGSLRPVEGYSPARANYVIRKLRKTRCRIIPGESATTIVTRRGAPNNAEFIMEVNSDRQHVVEDGRFVNAAVFDLKGRMLAQNVRMVFVKDTPPERAVIGLGRGARLHVFGLPRINLSAVAWRVEHASENPSMLVRSLPYEMVIMGVYKP